MIIMALCISTVGPLGVDRLAEAKATTPALKNIKITAKVVNVQKEKSINSKIICQATKDQVYELLSEEKDSAGKVWYKVDADFGVTGWVASWFCKKTNEKINSAIKSKSGELLYECTNKDLFVQLLLLEDYSLKSLLKTYGSSYSVRQGYLSKIYEYKNDINFEVSEDGDVETVGVGDCKFSTNVVKKKTCDIFKHKGKEIIIIYGNYLIIVDAANKKVLREYNIGYLEIKNFEVGNIVGDSNLELYLYGIDSESTKSGIYTVTNDDFTKVYHTDSYN